MKKYGELVVNKKKPRKKKELSLYEKYGNKESL